MREQGITPKLPPVSAPYLVEWWLEIGPTVSGGMGEAPIGWADMTAWERLAGIELEPWEAKALRRMSSAFISQRHEARKPSCPAPYSQDLPEETRDKVDQQFAAMFKALQNRKGLAKNERKP